MAQAKQVEAQPDLRYEIRLSLRGQQEIDPIEAWLKLNVTGAWKMEFLGMAESDKEGSAGKRLVVLYRFQSKEDAERFQRDRNKMPAAMPAMDGSRGAVQRKQPASGSAIGAISRSISEIFTPDKKQTARPPARPERAGAAMSAIEAADPEEFVKCAGDLLRNVDQMMASKVQLLGLDKVKAHFGESWGRIADRADQIAQRAIQKRLSKHDMVTKVQDLNYLILFAGVPIEEAQLRCRLIADDISKQLIGDGGSGDLLNVKTAAAPVDGKMLLEETPSIEELASRLVAKAEGNQDGAPAAKTDGAVVEEAADPLKNVELVYRPMWDLEKKVVASYLCLPAVRLAGGRREIGEAAIIGMEEEAVQKELDFRMLNRVIDDLTEVVNGGRRLLMAVPVHFATISATNGRIEYLQRCRRLSQLAAKLLLFEIVGAPEGVPAGRLLELVTALKSRSRAVLFRVPLSMVNISHLPQSGLFAIGADVSREHAEETVLVERFVKFADAAAKAKIRTYIHGLRSVSLAVAAIGAGFGYLSGEPVARVTDAPKDIQRFNLADFYASREA